MKYGPYPEYKDSGVAWLGEVPAPWEVKRFKNLARLNPPKSEISNTLPDMEVQFLPMEMVSEDGKFSLKETRSLSEVYHGFTYFRDGDVIMAKITPCFENGKGAIVDNLENGIGFGSTEFHVLRPTSGFSSYIWYITKSIPFRKIGIMEMKGVAGQQRVPESFVSEFLVATPPHGEQTTIAAFLDEKTTQIDQLIEKKTRFIELLKEKRAALITEAVTGKFDVRTGKPYSEYKDSGVEWLGEVPSHWEVKRFKNLARLNPPKSEISNTLPDIEVQFIPMEMVSENGKVSLKETRPLSEVYHGLTYFRDGDVIMAKITPCFENGKGAIVDNLENGIGFGSTEFHVLRPASGVSSYIWYITKSIPFRKIGIMEMKGVAGQQRVPESFVSEFIVAVPPVEEQTTIATFLDKKNTQIDQLIEKTQQSIDLLKEKRAALITAAVTGKIDVRDYNERNAA